MAIKGGGGCRGWGCSGGADGSVAVWGGGGGVVWGCSGYGGILTCIITEHAVRGVAEGQYGGGGLVDPNLCHHRTFQQYSGCTQPHSLA